jgi:hypothetical protein
VILLPGQKNSIKFNINTFLQVFFYMSKYWYKGISNRKKREKKVTSVFKNNLKQFEVEVEVLSSENIVYN